MSVNGNIKTSSIPSTDINIDQNILLNKKITRDSKLWNVNNTENIVKWTSTCNLNVLLLNTYLKYLKNILRINTLWSLLISSITSTISVTQFTISDIDQPMLSLGIKIVIFITSIITSLITGYIKVEKIQETIEIVEEHKNNWSSLMFSLLSEMQVPIELRKQAEIIIKEKREEFNNVNSKNMNIPSNIRSEVSQILVEKKFLKMNQEIKSCSDRCCNLSDCCRINHYHSINVATTKRKLSQYISINKLLEKEILSLLTYYPNEITQIVFDNDSDLFKFRIYTEDFKVAKKDIRENTVLGKNRSIYAPSDKAVNLFKNRNHFTNIYRAPTMSSQYLPQTFNNPNYYTQTYSYNAPYQSVPVYQPMVPNPVPQSPTIIPKMAKQPLASTPVLVKPPEITKDTKTSKTIELTKPVPLLINENKPDDNKPDDNKPDDNKPDDNKPDENKPDENKPDENKPDENKPDDNKPDENKPDDNKPDENKPDDNKPDDNKPGDNKPDENKPTDELIEESSDDEN